MGKGISSQHIDGEIVPEMGGEGIMMDDERDT
jgi:hypothetical protein